MRTAIAAPEPEYDWAAAEAEMDEFLAEPAGLDIRPEVAQEIAEAGWFDSAVPDWTGALCASHPDPDAWHPREDSPGGKFRMQQLAIAVCQPCPLIQRCRSYGIRHMKVGVWGGIALDPAKDPSTPDPRRLATHCRRQHSEWRQRGSQRICVPCERDRTRRHRAKKKEQRNASA